MYNPPPDDDSFALEDANRDDDWRDDEDDWRDEESRTADSPPLLEEAGFEAGAPDMFEKKKAT